MFRRFLFFRIWSSAQDHSVLVLLLNLVGFFISAWPRWSRGNVLYHSCTSFEGASLGGQPLNIFTWFIGAGGLTVEDNTQSWGQRGGWGWIEKNVSTTQIYFGPWPASPLPPTRVNLSSNWLPGYICDKSSILVLVKTKDLVGSQLQKMVTKI